jgi:hypothetical protein
MVNVRQTTTAAGHARFFAEEAARSVSGADDCVSCNPDATGAEPGGGISVILRGAGQLELDYRNSSPRNARTAANERWSLGAW